MIQHFTALPDGTSKQNRCQSLIKYPISTSLSNINKLPNLIEEVDIAKEINSEENSDDVLELLDSHNQEQAIELIEMQEQDIEELDSVDPLQSEDRMIVRNFAEVHSLIEKKSPAPTKNNLYAFICEIIP
ncbi:UNVERIFIED_CONTAM: hypothetical protein NCL1_04686 [Trichonephila clavipes]